MAIRKKKEQVKPALIMCAVVGIIIIVMFVAANSVNKNVVKNMKGRVLFYGDGLKMYDFDNDKLTNISGQKCFDGMFTDDGRVVFADGETNVFSIYDLNENKISETIPVDKGEIMNLAYSREKKMAALVICDGDRYMINTYGGDNFTETDTIVDSEQEICGICFDEDDRIYYTTYNNGTGILESVEVSGGTPESKLRSDGVKLTDVCVRGDYVYVCEEKPGDSDIVKYGIKLGRVTVPKFNSDEYNCTSIVTVSDEEYISACDRDGKWGLYVCNGSNMVCIENAGTYDKIKVTDYINIVND